MWSPQASLDIVIAPAKGSTKLDGVDDMLIITGNARNTCHFVSINFGVFDHRIFERMLGSTRSVSSVHEVDEFMSAVHEVSTTDKVNEVDEVDSWTCEISEVKKDDEVNEVNGAW